MPETFERLPFADTFAKPESLLSVPVGLASPLWGLFAGAAVGGSAWWWMTRWARTENLEAMFGSVLAAPLLALEPEPAAEAAVEAVIEPPVLEAPVGGESAPIAPAAALEAESADAPGQPKPRVRKAEPKAE